MYISILRYSRNTLYNLIPDLYLILIFFNSHFLHMQSLTQHYVTSYLRLNKNQTKRFTENQDSQEHRFYVNPIPLGYPEFQLLLSSTSQEEWNPSSVWDSRSLGSGGERLGRGFTSVCYGEFRADQNGRHFSCIYFLNVYMDQYNFKRVKQTKRLIAVILTCLTLIRSELSKHIQNWILSV